MTASLQPWIKCFHARPDARVRLICFPFAGGSASTYQTWHKGIGRYIEVWAVQPPGREERFREPPLSSRSLFIRTLADVLVPNLTKPFAMFGHSLGAGLAFELTRELRRRGARGPEHLFLSARRAPHLSPRRKVALYDLPEEEFVAQIRAYKGTPAAVLENAELMALFLPTLRADFGLGEIEPFIEERPIDCPIAALGGVRDEWVSTADIELWRAHTTGAFSRQLFPGDHFYLNTLSKMLFEVFDAHLSRFAR